jgi:hypothetical protein
MAKSLTKTTRTRKPKAEEEVKVPATVEEMNTDVSDEDLKPEEPKKFKDNDLIPCRSITTGELLVEGQKTKTLYRWADYGYVESMEYQDLLYDVRSANNSFANKPCFVVEDEDFIAQHPKLEALYASLYSNGDFAELITKDAATIQRVVPTLPRGARESLKSYVATQIRNGNLDSMNRIRAFDEIFGTQMATMLFPG